MNAQAPPADDEVPLCVDLDGTLCRSDALRVLALALLRTHPLSAARAGAASGS